MIWSIGGLSKIEPANIEGCSSESTNVIVEKPQASVTLLAKQPSKHPSNVIMVYDQGASLSANATPTSLFSCSSLDLSFCNTSSLEPSPTVTLVLSVTRLAMVLVPIGITTRPMKTIQTLSLPTFDACLHDRSLSYVNALCQRQPAASLGIEGW